MSKKSVNEATDEFQDPSLNITTLLQTARSVNAQYGDQPQNAREKLAELIGRTIQSPSLTQVDIVERKEARNLLYLLGFLVSSCERHSQALGYPAGAAIQSIPGLDQCLTQLGNISGHPPRDSLYTYILWNEGETFTGDPQEALFIDVVKKSTEELESARGILATTLSNPSDFFSTETLTVLEAVWTSLEVARKQFLRFYQQDQDGNPKFTQAFFINQMRQYNCTYPIGGVDYGGPTAANCVPWMCLDMMLGLANADYLKHCRDRKKYMTEEDQVLLEQSIAMPSLTTLILLNAPQRQNFENATPKSVPPIFSEIVAKVLNVHKKMCSLTALHWGLIQNFMVKQRGASAQQGPVDNQRGTSGMSFPDVEAIMQMRRISEPYKQLSSLLDLTDGRE